MNYFPHRKHHATIVGRINQLRPIQRYRQYRIALRWAYDVARGACGLEDGAYETHTQAFRQRCTIQRYNRAKARAERQQAIQLAKLLRDNGVDEERISTILNRMFRKGV